MRLWYNEGYESNRHEDMRLSHFVTYTATDKDFVLFSHLVESLSLLARCEDIAGRQSFVYLGQQVICCAGVVAEDRCVDQC